MTESDSDRRRHPRYDTEDLPGELVFSLDADVKNISLAGMAVTTRNPFTVDRVYTVQLGDQDDTVEIEATVRWCHFAKTEIDEEGDSITIYEAGFEFQEILSDRARDLLTFLEEHVVLDLEERLFGRLEPRNDRSVHLSSEYEFAVKKISNSGMLIEIGSPLPQDEVFPMTIRLGDGTFETPGRIASVVKPGIEGKRLKYHIGVEFVETDPRERELLGDFIRNQLAKGTEIPPQPPPGEPEET